MVAARFALRGTWGEAAVVRVAVERGGGPTGVDLGRAVDEARARWNALGSIRLERVEPAPLADVVVSWQRGLHGPCPAFGVDTSVAHAGPVERGTWLHVDAERAWDQPGGPALVPVLCHELGHVLGLGHARDAGALMASDPRVDAPARSDRDGLHTLYGGGGRDAFDLVIRRGDEELAVLHGAAPTESGGSDFELFDTDGDGDDELVLWRAASDGPSCWGELVAFHFVEVGARPRPARTVSPPPCFVLGGARLDLFVLPAGERVVVQQGEGEARVAYRFDEGGLPAVLFDGPLPDVAAEPERQREGDLDGDGRRERVERRRVSR